MTIFSRVSEEIEALTTYGIDYELVPGVSSAFAAPALAGFPLTDKNLGTSFAVRSAHAPDSIDWAALRCAVDTVVLLMTGRTFAAVLAGAMQAGWSADTSVRNPSCDPELYLIHQEVLLLEHLLFLSVDVVLKPLGSGCS